MIVPNLISLVYFDLVEIYVKLGGIMSKVQKRKFVFSLIIFLFLMSSIIFVLNKGKSYDLIQNYIFFSATLTVMLVFLIDTYIEKWNYQ